jgi:hypothetical protein
MRQEIWKKHVHGKTKTPLPNKALKLMFALENKLTLNSYIYDDTRNLEERCSLAKEDTISKQSFKVYARNPRE